MFGLGNGEDTVAKLAALHRAQAIIRFETNGGVVTASQTALDAVGYALPGIQRKHLSMFVEPKGRGASRSIA